MILLFLIIPPDLINKFLYYIDTSVLLENIPLVTFIKVHPGPEWFIFHNLTREFIDDVILVISLYYFSDVFCLHNKKNITRRLEDMNFIFSWQNQYFTNERIIFTRPCNILYITLKNLCNLFWDTNFQYRD